MPTNEVSRGILPVINRDFILVESCCGWAHRLGRSVQRWGGQHFIFRELFGRTVRLKLGSSTNDVRDLVNVGGPTAKRFSFAWLRIGQEGRNGCSVPFPPTDLRGRFAELGDVQVFYLGSDAVVTISVFKRGELDASKPFTGRGLAHFSRDNKRALNGRFRFARELAGKCMPVAVQSTVNGYR